MAFWVVGSDQSSHVSQMSHDSLGVAFDYRCHIKVCPSAEKVKCQWFDRGTVEVLNDTFYSFNNFTERTTKIRDVPQ